MKKKLLALFLVLALVFSSAFTMLVACNRNEGEGEGENPGDGENPGTTTTEYKVSFCKNGKEIFALTTTDGKLNKADVEAETQKNIARIDNRQSEGYFFTGWFTTKTKVDGEEVYEGAINYGKKYTANAEYEAGYEFLPTSGEEEGYTLVGGIGDVEDWDWGGTTGTGMTDDWKLVQDEDEGWIYRISNIKLVGGAQFKVKTYGVIWDKGLVNYGYDNIGEVVLAEGVEPELKGHDLKDDLFNGDNKDSNFGVSAYVITANVDIELNYRAKKVNITVNEISVLDELPEIEYILVGAFPEAEWAQTTELESLIFQKTAQEGVVEVSHDFTDGLKWRIKTNALGWEGCYGFSHINKITKADTVEDEIPEDLFSAATDDDNILVNYDCTLTLTLDYVNGTVDVFVTALTIPAPETIHWESAGYVIVGGFTDANWVKPAAPGSKYLFTQDDDNKNIGTWTGDIPKDTSFKVATNISAWTGRINIGWGTSASYVDTQGSPVTGLFMQEGSDNICTAAKCNVTITLDVAAKTIVVRVNSHDPIVTDEPNRDKWSLIGTSAAGWSADVDLELQENGHHTISGYQLKVGEFKVRKDHAWTTSCGSHTQRITVKSTVDGVSDATAKGYFNFNQDNIKVTTACTVDIDFVFYSASNWAMIITVTAV